MDASLLHIQPSRPIAHPLTALPGLVALFQPGLHLESQEPRYAAQLFGSARLLCAIPTLGVDGFQPGRARERSKRRNLRRDSRTYLVFLFGRLSVATRWLQTI